MHHDTLCLPIRGASADGFASLTVPIHRASTITFPTVDAYQNRRDAIYEDAFRDVVVAEPPGAFGVEDVTGLPWVEIDFPEDLEKAGSEVLPALIGLPSGDPESGALREAGV